MKDHDSIIPVEDDEFQGLGDDLVNQVKPASAVAVKEKVVRSRKTRQQKDMRVILKRSGLAKPPPVEQILQGRMGEKVSISEIGFLSLDEHSDPVLNDIATACPIRNRLNRDEVLKSRVLVIGSQILKAGRMWTPILVYRDVDSGRLECISGRHRLTFLALVYGTDLEVPVHIENMTLKEAREAAAVANDSRPIKALERASYAILRAVGGDTEANQDQVYRKLATNKLNVGKYCVFSVIERELPSKLSFNLSERSSRPDGGVTTVSNIECFWNEAFAWTRDMTRQEFDKELKESVSFLNVFIDKIKKIKGFDSSQHLSAGVMSALGRYYLSYKNITHRSAISVCGKMAEGVVGLGQTSKRPQSELYNALAGCMAGT